MRRWWLIGLALLVFTACGGAPNTPLPDAHQALVRAAEVVGVAQSFAVIIEHSGAPTTLNTDMAAFEFLRASGHFVAPNRIQATVRIKSPAFDLITEVEVLAVGSEQYYRSQTLSGGAWLNEEFSPGFNPADLLAEDRGIQVALASAHDLQMVGREDLDGRPVLHIRGLADGLALSSITVGLIRSPEVEVDIYLNPDDYTPERIVIVEPGSLGDGASAATTWNIELYDYNQPFEIEQPEGA